MKCLEDFMDKFGCIEKVYLTPFNCSASLPLVLWYGGRFRKPSTHQKWCSYFVLPEGLGSLFKPTHNVRLKSSGDLQKAAGPEPPGPCKIRCAFSRYISWSWTEKMVAKNTGGFQCFYASHAVMRGILYIFLIPISWSKRTKTKQRTPPKFQWLFCGLHEVTSV